MVLGMLVEAIQGAAQEVKAAPTAQEKARRAYDLTKTILRELLGMCSSLPYAFHAISLWRHPEKQQQRWGFNLLRNVRYGPADRNLLDVYTPSTCDVKSSLPVLMFIHGGVWASGDKSFFSPIGATLAHHGVVALLVQYSLYPQVLAKEQLKEISRALTWAMDNVSRYGGNPNKIHVMGHSSGGHLCGMLLWERARRNLSFKKGSSPSEEVEDRRYPRCFLGLSGVYNIGEHYKYEERRGVAAISCMNPAMNGPSEFSAMSPELLFGSLLALKCNQGLQPIEKDHFANDLSNVDTENLDWSKWASQQPPFAFFASDNDIVVPPLTSVNFHNVLQELGCKSGVSLHESLAHDDFAAWVKGIWGKNNPIAKVLIRDVLDIVKENRKVDSFLHSQVDVSN